MIDRPPVLTARDARLRARHVLSPDVWRYLETRADGSRRDRNSAAWRDIALLPRILRGVSAVDTAIKVLGRPLATPVLTAPNGRATRFHPDGETAVLTGAAAAGTGTVLASTALHALGAASVHPSAVWAQIYLSGDPVHDAETAARASAAGAHALTATVDLVPRTGGRAPPAPPAAWDIGAPLAASPVHAAASLSDLARLCAASPLPVVVKGVLRADDALACLDAGASGLVVSNHGDAQLAGATPTATALAEVCAAVGVRAEVYVDGGVSDGATILRALALGARAVLVGRPVSHALACDGAVGVQGLLDGLTADLARAMALCGVTTLSEVTADLVRQR